MVAEELECDWSKVVTEYPTPRTERRLQAAEWGSFSGTGSRGIRMKSQEYVRAGAALRPRA